MGEVYRARDTRLDRTVAVKVLSGTLAAEAESRQRFEQEARAIAALNDPHICTIHDVGRHGDLDYIVLEYLEGETLADRLRRTPVLPVDEALAIAIQIGSALDRAHRAGIAHRDLKPGNVMLLRRAAASNAPDVKLLDFGLAARTTTSRPPARDASLDITTTGSLAATRPMAVASSGLVGTLHYMSPEQLDGGEGDHRVDIFAFGCVLYEMLAGRKAFEGGSTMTAIAAIMSTEPPPIPALEAGHPLINHVMRRCLEKDRERRWQNIGDVVSELRWAAAHPIAVTAAPLVTRKKLSASGKLALIATAAVTTLLLFAGLRALRQSDPAGTPALRLEISTAPTDDTTLALSADGRRIAFVANQKRRPVLWVRALDGAESRVLPGTDGASFPFWSPDGKSLGFFADGKVKRIDVDGGQPIVLANAPNGRGGAWNSDGVILFAPSVSDPIMRVPASGGKAEAVTEAGPASGPDHRWPQFLPGGKQFLYSSTLGTPETNGIYVASLDKTPPRRILDSGIGRFAPPDRLLTVADGALRAYRFDPATGVKGEAVVVAQGLAAGTASVAASDGGMLAYRSGTPQRRQLIWVDRAGRVLREIGEPETGYLGSPELSPDEHSVAVFSPRSGDNDIWVIELARGLARRVTEGPPADAHPVWDPDGDHVAFVSSRLGRRGPLRQSLTSGKLEPLFPDIDRGAALSWSRDRRYVLLRREGVAGPAELVAMATSSDEPRVVPIPQSQNSTEGQFSPDGKWVASVADESGRPEVFVQSFPDGQMRTQVSTGGGTQGRWSADGREIFYLAPDRKLMAVSIALGGPSPQVQLPRALFDTYLATGTNVIGNKPQYAVSRDGRFLLNTAIESASSPIVIAVNWMQ